MSSSGREFRTLAAHSPPFSGLGLTRQNVWCRHGVKTLQINDCQWRAKHNALASFPDSIYCRVLNKFADAGLNDRMAPLWEGLWRGYSRTRPLARIDALQLKRFFLLREAIICGHYHRTLDVASLDDSFKAGLEVMRQNVENQEHQVDFERLAKACEKSANDPGHATQYPTGTGW